ncbi:MAG TPA: sigma 54-interacting transcriptional regulator [Methylomirabilota bacterium]|nr:sigma 54-interacting transcriptional regulator [Methylomirabilota bacterium]
MEGRLELLGESAALETVRETIRRLVVRQQVGRRMPSILIQGETGTGKGLVAHLIHRQGPRSRGSFVDVNCAAIPETLLEAELFGFERGAFTDARRAKPGLFQTAHQGTLFLDEVALLPEALQAKLLTVLEERVVRRLGSTHPEPADAWIISATNADLQSAIKEHRFREDLYHRLAVLTIKLPPLREREADILLLAERFLANVCAEYGLPAKTLSADARERLAAYSWPGNVRELGNVIERAALLADASSVTAHHLELREDVPVASPPSRGRDASGVGGISMGDAMRDHLLSTLEQTGWNISRTAAMLQISRNTLRARIERLGLRSGTDPQTTVQRGERNPPLSSTPASAGSDSVTLPARPAASSAPDAPVLPPIRWQRRRVTLLRAALGVPASEEERTETSRALELLVDKIRTFGGRVEEFGQTGLDASFGLEPIEDAPRRAANAAMAILKAVERAREQHAGILPVRIALHTGPYMIGQISGTPQIDQAAKREAGVILDALVQAAEPDSAVVSGATVPFLERRFALIPAGLVGGPGGQIHRLVGREPDGFGPLARMGKFVGRRSEQELLQNRWASALRGRGQLVGVVGEPGVGKSRLVREFINALGDGALVLETSSFALGNPAPYLPIVELLRSYFHLDIGEDADVIRRKVSDAIRGLDENLLPALSALLTLLDVPVPDPAWQSLAPAQRRQRTFDGVKRLMLRETRRRPLLLVFEDTHWNDAETQALLDSFVDGLPAAHVLVLLTYRPEYSHGWSGKSFYTQLRVDPLQPETAAELLGDLLGTHPSLQPLTERLIEWTEGNPFFLEESVRALVETGALAGEHGAYWLTMPVSRIQVPATVEEVLAVRIDRLTAEQCRLLQSAAVVGKDVPYPILAAIADLSEEAIGETLRQLQAAEFLYETSPAPELEYTFKHVLTREVAYASLAQGKRTLHARILAVMETLYTDRLEEHIDRLAHHAFQGHVWDKAVDYLRQAGARASERSAGRDAVGYFDQAFAALAHLPNTRSTHELDLDLRFEVRNVLQTQGEFGPLLAHLQKAEALARSLADDRQLGWVSAYLTDYFRLTGDQDRAIDAGERALQIAESLNDFALQVATYTWLGQALHGRGEYRRAATLFTKNVESLVGDRLIERFGAPQPRSVHSRTCLVWCLTELGEFREGTRRGEEALQIAQPLEHPLSLTTACAGLGYLYLRQGQVVKAISLLERGLEATRAANSPLWFPRVASALGLAYSRARRVPGGIALLEDAVAQGAAMKMMGAHSLLLISLGEGYLLADRVDDAAVAAEQALRLAREHVERGNEARALLLLADIALRSDPPDTERAREQAATALARAEDLELRPVTALCHLTLGRADRLAGQKESAARHLSTAAALFRDMGMQPWLIEAERELQQLP